MTIPVNKSRQLADCFKLLAVFFYEPEMELWKQEDILFRFAEEMNKIVPDAFPAANRMGQALTNIDEEQMQVDYAALFVGPFELLAAPYGSVYLERTKRIMGDSTMAVLDLYRQAGLKVDIKDAPDHIAIELEFLHYLYSIEGKASQDGDRAKERHTENLRVHFLNTCLGPWVHQFCQSIQSGTENLFYINLAECLELFIAQVSEYDSEVLTEQSFTPKEHADQPSV
jgi:putative dimethyl sulfoxide reductase chaperone